MAAALWFPAPDARAEETEVDVALVLAVDVSRSMDPDEQELQRQGFMEAFRSPQVHDAIRNGMLGRIIVTYMEWSGVEYQNVIVPWTIIDGPECAAEIRRGPQGQSDRPPVGGPRFPAPSILA